MSDVASNWETLFEAAIPALDHVFGEQTAEDPPAWTFGGGTALMLQINHRVSHHIDIFLQRSNLKAFTPHKNPAAARISDHYQWPGHYVKFERPDGEIDFLEAPLQTEPDYRWERIHGRQVALETPEEIIVKKIRYRSQSFKARDAFDLAAVASKNPRLAITLATEVSDALPRLAESLRVLAARGWPAQAAAVAPLEFGIALLPRALEEASTVVRRAAEISAARTSRSKVGTRKTTRSGRDPTD